ncbi:MAG: hypothetical protein V1495_08405 [Pseudomonadota bacterium]
MDDREIELSVDYSRVPFKQFVTHSLLQNSKETLATAKRPPQVSRQPLQPASVTVFSGTSEGRTTESLVEAGSEIPGIAQLDESPTLLFPHAVSIVSITTAQHVATLFISSFRKI